MPSSVHDTFGFSEEAVVPSTKEQVAPGPGSLALPVCGVIVHEYVTGPSTSSEPEPSSCTVAASLPEYGPPASATGTSLTQVTVMETVAVSLPPLPSETV